MSKVKETIKIILVVAVLAVGVFFGVNYLLHPQNESVTTTPTTTKKTTAKKTPHKAKINLVAVGDSLTEGSAMSPRVVTLVRSKKR